VKILVSDAGRKIFADSLDSDLQTDLGVIKAADIKKAKPGDTVKSHNGTKFLVLERSFIDMMESMRRGPAIIQLKDMAYIAASAGVRDGHRIVDAGTGSGTLTVYLAMCCAPSGIVYSYERDKRFTKLARENIKRSGLKNIKLRDKDIYDGIAEKDIDLITLDLPEPWRVDASKLNPGGFLVAYLPNMTQVQRFVSESDKRLKVIEVVELIKRAWVVKDQVARPEHRLLGHTGFLVICRKI
jgi:tRNA (adenine57-N1/adenine58-N1)-methyltransferase